MSEYQYYEFRAIDRPLDKAEMEKLRTISSRAEITPTSFTNTYNYGDFHGKPEALVAQYFDAFVYVTNWGTHQLMLRIPQSLLDIREASVYGVEDFLTIEAKNGSILLNFTSDDETEGGWTDGEGWMESMIAVRAELMRGDLRALYLGWLASLRYLEPDDDAEIEAGLEPPVPPGLSKLSKPLEVLADFLRLDAESIRSAAAGNLGEPPAEPARIETGPWIKNLPVADKDDYLQRFLAEEGDIMLRAELWKRYRDATATKGKAKAKGVPRAAGSERRTIGQLLQARDALVEETIRLEAKKAAAERDRKNREQAEARKLHLDEIASRGTAAWDEVDALIATSQPKEYDRAVSLLVDLRELARRTGNVAQVEAKIEQLRQLHKKRPSLMTRFKKNNLDA